MNSNHGSIFGHQCQPQMLPDTRGLFDPTTEEGIVKGLSDLTLWTPVTPLGYSVISQALVLIQHLKDCNKQIGEDPYLKLRAFGAEMLRLLVPLNNDPNTTKQIFFYNYPNNEVYFGYPASLESESPPTMLRAVLGSGSAIRLSLDEAITVTKHNTDIIQSRVFGMPLKETVYWNPANSPMDWEFTMRIDTDPFEKAFMLDFVLALKGLRVRDPETVYETFKDKFNISRILNSGQRTTMDLRVFCVRAEVHWEWVNSQ